MSLQEVKYVTTKLFFSVIGFVGLVIGWLIVMNANLSARVDTMTTTYTEIKVQLSQIQADLIWIKNENYNLHNQK